MVSKPMTYLVFWTKTVDVVNTSLNMSEMPMWRGFKESEVLAKYLTNTSLNISLTPHLFTLILVGRPCSS